MELSLFENENGNLAKPVLYEVPTYLAQNLNLNTKNKNKKKKVMENKKIICWWSGGITSAVACKVAIDLYGKENCSVIMIDTINEDEDTYRFFKDCEKWFGLEIKIISGIPNNEQGRKNYEFVNVGYEYSP